ncbi:hypothetical protein EXW93_06950 [Exiguobacterium sp. JMULE1]|uniref:hypothetical protein n=1 Tax=Exiguobacterium sp. JMULE1 TaxID=2518339 RepID=UPI0015759C16|nr:hypothetical protein [Exiguobacterium sp. JMULE1]NTY09331.1 hypothetical protein [Exiguobacterium sp. JMULE1]
MGPTNDMWVWVLSYAFFFITLISAIFVAIKHPALRKASIRAVVAMLFLYALFIWNSMYRLDITEFRHFYEGLTTLRPWAWMCVFLIAYTLKWWYLVFLHTRRPSPSSHEMQH